MFLACAFWGLMAPLGKDAMTHGIDGMMMVAFRVAGGALLGAASGVFGLGHDKAVMLRRGCWE